MRATNLHSLRGPYRRLVEKYDEEQVMGLSTELSFTRSAAINDLGCANFKAMKILEKQLRSMGVKTARQLYGVQPSKLAGVEGVGTIALYVAMLILDYYEFDIANWWGWQDKERTRAKKTISQAQQASA